MHANQRECEEPKKKTRYTTKNLREQIEHGVGVAEAFLGGSVANFMGTYWPVGAAAAAALTFSEQFYLSLLNGKPFADAVQKAREAVNAKKSADWADYIQYGNVEFHLRFR